MKTNLILLSLLITSFLSAQNAKSTFDFWIGNWDAYWNGDTLRGSNTITKTLNAKVIEENFSFKDGSFYGRSWSVFDSASGVWKQTWVDDSGAYIALTGGKSEDKIILKTIDKKSRNGKTISMRMVFYNIKADSFDWDWQSSTDEITWKSGWLIHYKRKK